MLEQCCKHSKQCHNSVATLCWAKNRHCESSHVTLPIVIYLILLFIPLARCGRIGDSFTRTSCGKSNINWGKSTLNSVNLLCLKVIGDKSQFLQTFLWCTNVCNVLWLCWAIAYGPSGSLSKAKENHGRFYFFLLFDDLNGMYSLNSNFMNFVVHFLS